MLPNHAFILIISFCLPLLVKSIEIAFIHPIEWTWRDWKFEELRTNECTPVANSKDDPVTSIKLRVGFMETRQTPVAIGFYTGQNCDPENVKFVIAYYYPFSADQTFSLSDLPDIADRSFKSYKTLQPGTNDWLAMLGNAQLEPGDVPFKDNTVYNDWLVQENVISVTDKPDETRPDPRRYELYQKGMRARTAVESDEIRNDRPPPNPSNTDTIMRSISGVGFSGLASPIPVRSWNDRLDSDTGNPLIPVRRQAERSHQRSNGLATDSDEHRAPLITSQILEQIDEDTESDPWYKLRPPMRVPGNAEDILPQEKNSGRMQMKANPPRTNQNAPFSKFRNVEPTKNRLTDLVPDFIRRGYQYQQQSKLNRLQIPEPRMPEARRLSHESPLTPSSDSELQSQNKGEGLLPIADDDNLGRLLPDRYQSTPKNDDLGTFPTDEYYEDMIPDERGDNEKLIGTQRYFKDTSSPPRRERYYSPLLRGIQTEPEQEEQSSIDISQEGPLQDNRVSTERGRAGALILDTQPAQIARDSSLEDYANDSPQTRPKSI